MPNPATTAPAEEMLTATSSDAAATNEEQSSDPRLQGLQESEPDLSVPDKFKGKSLQEIAKSYSELEKMSGRLGSEKAQKEKEASEAQARIAHLEQERQALYQQLQSNSSVPRQQQPQEPDPIASFEEDVARDPVEAVKNLGKRMIQESRQTKNQLAQELRSQQANDYYQRQLKENQDFAALDKDMQQLALRVGHLVKPESANSPETINLLYQLARAQNMDRYVSDAVSKSKSASDMVRAEKRSAVSESTNSQGESSTSFEDLPLEDMQRLLGRGR